MISAMFVARRTAWFRTYFYFAIGTGLGFFFRLAMSLAIVRGIYSSGTLYDLAWIRAVPLLRAGGAGGPGFAREPAAVEAPVADAARGGRGRAGVSDPAHRLRHACTSSRLAAPATRSGRC